MVLVRSIARTPPPPAPKVAAEIIPPAPAPAAIPAPAPAPIPNFAQNNSVRTSPPKKYQRFLQTPNPVKRSTSVSLGMSDLFSIVIVVVHAVLLFTFLRTVTRMEERLDRAIDMLNVNVGKLEMGSSLN